MFRAQCPDMSDDLAKDLFYARSMSVAVHKSTHAVIQTKPGTKFHAVIEDLLGGKGSDPDAQFSTLCDESLAMGLQGLLARSVSGSGVDFGKPGYPRIESVDSDKARMSKIAGEQIQPLLRDLLADDSKIDQVLFLKKVCSVVQMVQQEFIAQKPKEE